MAGHNSEASKEILNKAKSFLKEDLINLVEVTFKGLEPKDHSCSNREVTDTMKFKSNVFRTSVFQDLAFTADRYDLMCILPNANCLKVFTRQSAIEHAALLMKLFNSEEFVIAPSEYQCCVLCGLEDAAAVEAVWRLYLQTCK